MNDSPNHGVEIGQAVAWMRQGKRIAVRNLKGVVHLWPR